MGRTGVHGYGFPARFLHQLPSVPARIPDPGAGGELVKHNEAGSPYTSFPASLNFLSKNLCSSFLFYCLAVNANIYYRQVYGQCIALEGLFYDVIANYSIYVATLSE